MQGWLTDSTLTAVHSTAEAGGQYAIGLQDAEFFANMAVLWILLPVFAARMYPGILSRELSSWCVSWNRTTVTLWVFTSCSMMLIFALVRPSTFSCGSEIPCLMADMSACTEKGACSSSVPNCDNQEALSALGLLSRFVDIHLIFISF